MEGVDPGRRRPKTGHSAADGWTLLTTLTPVCTPHGVHLMGLNAGIQFGIYEINILLILLF